MVQFTSKKPGFEYLRKKWTTKHKAAADNFWLNHGQSLRQLAIGSLGGLLIFSPSSPKPLGPEYVSRDDILKGFDQNVLLAEQLNKDLPKEVRPLALQEEENIVRFLSDSFGFKVTSEVNKIKLNRSYGLIGGEQHLYRYPGDTLYAHADNTVEWAKFGEAGIASGLGAWGYFAPSKEEFSEKDKLREKYYLAIPTFLVPGYAENVTKYRDFFKFRKMIVINPQTGQAVVAVIGDVGPAEFTGKHLGGSPEVMDSLGLATGPRKGAVLYFFIDDPQDDIPLGPIKVLNKA